ANGNFIGTSLFNSNNSNGITLFAPSYQSPRSVQMNGGIQHEIRPGTVISADYVRNVATHPLLSIDVNHTGDSRFLNVTNAVAAINATITAAGCPAVTQTTAIAGVTCYLGANPGASISDFAVNGLDSTVDSTGGPPCPTCAFPGIEPNVGLLPMLFSVGRSVYNGSQLQPTQQLKDPVRGIKGLNLQVSYALSRYG